MSKKQLSALFMCNLIPFVVGNSLMALLPIYISKELGAGTVLTGIVIAIAFAVLVVSTSMSATISRKLGRYRDVITVCSLLCIPALWYAGQVQNSIIFTALLCVEWFFGGLQLALIQVITALTVTENERGRTFGLLATVGPLSQIIGGFAAGTIVMQWGFEALFIYCSILYCFSLILSRYITDPHITPIETVSSKTTASPIPTALLMIMGASVVAHIASFIISMARPLAMDALHFEASAVTSTVTISGLVTLALPFFAGWVSDKAGRQFVFIGIYSLTAMGAMVYIFADALWQFWIAQALVSVLAASMAVGSALVTDRVAREDTEKSISYFATTPWIGAVIGSASAGVVIQQLGTTIVFAMATSLLIIAIMLGSGITISHRLSSIKKGLVKLATP